MKLSVEEKHFIDKISSVTGINPKTVREVFLGLLTATAIEIYTKNDQIFIPYLFSLKINPQKRFRKDGCEIKELYDFKTSRTLHDVIVKIASGKKAEVERFIKREISEHIDSILEIDKEEEG